MDESFGVKHSFQLLDNLYGNNAEGIGSLDMRLKAGTLSLFLGAGVSIDAHVPGWKELLRRLLEQVETPDAAHKKLLTGIHYHLTQEVPLTLGQQVTDVLGDAFVAALKRVLYGRIQRSELIEALGGVCERSRAIGRVVTYNYDDLFEIELRQRRLGHRVITSSEGQIEDELTNVIHIHGYVPREKSKPAIGDLVLGEAKYHKLYNHPYNWINIVQLSTLLQYDALFVGFSFNDPNVRRLLEVSRDHAPAKRRFAILRRVHADDLARAAAVTLGLSLEEDRARRRIIRALTDMGDSIEWLYDMQADLYARLGLDVLWVENHSDIPDLLKQLGNH